MNKRKRTMHLLLTMLLMVSVVVLSGHNYSHSQQDLTTCQLCIHHGSSGSGTLPDVDVVFIATIPATFSQDHQALLPANTDFYRQPSRAPPHFI
jgi:hypothetical protein